MDCLLEKYVGDLIGFTDFLQREYGWIIQIDNNNKRIMVDENKDFCVCPITAATHGKYPRYFAIVQPILPVKCSPGF